MRMGEAMPLRTKYKEHAPHLPSDLLVAGAFLEILDPKGEFTFQTFGEGVGKANRELARILHGRLEDHASELETLQQKGAGVFVTVNKTDGAGRKEENITRVRALFVDLDGAPLEPVKAFPLKPTIIIETSPGRWHVYWLVSDIELSEFGEFQRALIKKFSSDPAVHDAPRVMRLPGFWHLKGEPFQVGISEADKSAVYTRSNFVAALGHDPADTPERKNTIEDTSRQPAVGPLIEGCAWLKHCRDDAAQLPEPEWTAMLSIVGRCKDGRSLAHEWSRAYPHYDAAETDKKLTAALKKAGPRTCEAIAEKLNGEDFCKSCVYRGRLRSPISLGTDYLREIIEGYIYVVGTKRFYDRETGQFLDKEQINDLWLHRHKGTSNPTRRALQSRMLVKVANPTYLPGGALIVQEERERRLNLWRPSDVTPDPGGDATPFLKHMNYLIPDRKARNHVLDFMAHIVQRPGDKINHAILLQGEQGTGKSFLCAALELILGQHNVAVVDTTELHSSFTGWIKDVQLVVVEEMMAFKRQDLMNKFKPLITQPHLRINEKYVPQYRFPNRVNFLLFTNHEDAIILDKGDRRYFVYHSPAHPKGPEYYRELFSWLAASPGALLHWLQSRNLNNFNPNERPPMTAAKRDVIEASRPPLETYLRDKLEAEEWPFLGDLAVPSHIADALPPNLRTSVNKVSGVLIKLGGEKLGQKRLKDGTKPTVYAMRKKNEWRQASESKISKHCRDPSLEKYKGKF